MSASALPDGSSPVLPESERPSHMVGSVKAIRSWSFPESLAWACLALAIACSLLLPDFGYGRVDAIAKGFSVWQIGLALVAFLFAAWFAGANWSIGRSQRLSIIWLMVAVVVAWHGMATSWAMGRTNIKHAIAGFWQSTAFWLLLPTIAWLARSVSDAARVLNALWILTAFVLVSGFWDATLLAERFGHAGFLVAVWPLLLGWFVQSVGVSREEHGETEASQRTKYAWGVPFVLLLGTALGLLHNRSGTAWLAAAFVTLLALLFDPLLRADILRCFKQRTLGAIAFMVVLLALVGTTYFLDPRLITGLQPSIAKSSGVWQGTLALIGKQPWSGFGSLNFESSFSQLETFTGIRPPSNPRNFLLELAHTGGWPLLGLSLLLLGVASIRGCCRQSFGEVGDESSLNNMKDTGPSTQRSQAAISFWTALCFAVIGIIVYAFFVNTGAMAGGEPLALGVATVFGFWLNRNRAVGTSVQGLVRDHSVLLLISFWGALVYFLTVEGWMVPAEMIGAVSALGLWIAAKSGGEPSGDVAHGAKTTKGAQRWLGVAIAMFLIGVWGWSMAVPLARSNQVWFSMVAGANAEDDGPIQPDAYAKEITSVRFDPDVAELGMGYCVGMLGRNLSENTKERWLHQFQQSRTWLIERDPGNPRAYASAGRQSIRACASMMGANASAQNTVSPGGGGGRRGQSGGGRRGMSPIASRMLTESLGYYREAASRAPGNPEIHLQAAVAAALVGNWKVCETLFDKAEKIQNENATAKRSSQEPIIWIPNAMIPVMESQAKRGGKISEEKNEAWEALVQHVGQNESVDGELITIVLRSFLKSNE